MSKRSAFSIPAKVDRGRLKRKMDSPVSRTDSSSDLCEGSNCDLMAHVLLSYVHTAPLLVGPASSVAGTHPTPSEGESDVLRARQLPFDHRQVNFLVSETVLRRGSLWRNIADDPFAAYHEAAKVMSAKKGSGSRTVSGDDVVVTGSRCATMVKTEPSSSLQGKKPKIGGVTTRLLVILF
ncbi:hypothetical protein Bca52824_065231 [Brassica carinata]|uniref:Uncharacterized protein n=1 Tax=Brassica carinata TaxID=52824 RepID=A0A8X7UAX9_BRACI|nr:hypothetical protein Bca52824_065231 [Brassica carinata]